ncbi:16S rRNA processing protein RimM [Wolbachia endosymbiont of Cruorifilaria tuberocauda]|uniref:ribosome maturation factor RimM n=1 Tax=Wolbachia endosymbiont of Cruorifilaria tuberocauda TaxID=1812111 RepID=UPI00158DC9C6|nr:ribosome maturation factor RimM [Wolbachia endosymbiont of Cruorifilaria tuberocauda]QKX01405.1 16S rRNA processing protein RimM [Wolbachia endosymbiont of Cruorifilaria tuberocauda]
MDNNLVCLGVVISPHGVNGAIKIKTFTEKPENISLYGRLISNGENYKIDSMLVINDNLIIASIDGIDSRNKAELLRNKKLYIERSMLPRLDNENKNEFYQSDLIGMKVRLKDSNPYGYVKSICNFGSGDILEISVVSTKKSIMLSFTREIFPDINIEEKYIVLSMPEFVD